MKILVVHGISHKEVQAGWPQNEENAILQALAKVSGEAHQVSFFMYDQKFEDAPLANTNYEQALKKLLPSLILHGITDIFNRPRDLVGFIKDRFRWTAGMVAQWATNEKLRKDLRESLRDQIKIIEPDMIVAHSMGSLIVYDLFTEKGFGEDLRDLILVTLGSQIQNPGLRSMWGGHLTHLNNIRHWYNLYNPHDNVLVCDITLSDSKFTDCLTPFEEDGPYHHAWEYYVNHTNAIDNVWRTILQARPINVARDLKSDVKSVREVVKIPRRRALLVGINNYPNPENHLEGCVNDVFQMSAILQECGFDAGDIRVLLDDRATAAGIRDRLGWLLEEVQPGDERIFFYSGHGAQIPQYDITGRVTGNLESLVPFDFNFEPATSITDLDMMDLYANLPYDSQVVFIFDCCHSGGLTREGGARIRGISPPDDIRHRMLRWDSKNEMWVRRELDPLIEGFVDEEQRSMFIGDDGATVRIGRAVPLRSTTRMEFDRIRVAKGNSGPFMPLIISACKQDELSYEYRHGVVSYGAFTYCVARTLRKFRSGNTNPTFAKLVSVTRDHLKELKYNQTPEVAGPKTLINSKIPWTKS